MSSDQFKSTYLAPLDHALRKSNISVKLLVEQYYYPFGNAEQVEGDVQKFFDEKVADSIKILYRQMYGRSHEFGRSWSILRPPLNRSSIIKPDMVHL